MAPSSIGSDAAPTQPRMEPKPRDGARPTVRAVRRPRREMTSARPRGSHTSPASSATRHRRFAVAALMEVATTYLGPLLLPRRALDFCFFPGGPPELPRGVLASPGFFGFAIADTLRSAKPRCLRKRALTPVFLPGHEARGIVVPQLEPQCSQCLPQRNRRHVAEDRCLVVSALQLVVRDLGAEVMDVVKADVPREELQDLGEPEIGASPQSGVRVRPLG